MYKNEYRAAREEKKDEEDQMNKECARVEKNNQRRRRRHPQTGRERESERKKNNFLFSSVNENTHDLQIEHTLLFPGYIGRLKTRINQVENFQFNYVYVCVCKKQRRVCSSVVFVREKKNFIMN